MNTYQFSDHNHTNVRKDFNNIYRVQLHSIEMT